MKQIILVLIILALDISYVKAQTTIDTLLCKEWKLKSYEESGKIFSPAPDQINNRMIFYFDHKVKSIETGNIQNGIWKYDSKAKMLMVVDNLTKEKVVLKVIRITKDECILEFKDPEGALLKMHMVSVTKR